MDQTSLLSSMIREIGGLGESVRMLAAAYEKLQFTRRKGTVVILPAEGFAGPKFLSWTVEPQDAGGEVRTSLEPLSWELPAYSWVVSHGCELGGVFNGHDMEKQDPFGNWCRTSRPVPLGVRLSVVVRFGRSETR